MAKNDNLKDFLANIADAIREKTETTELINPQDFSDKILSIETGSSSEASGVNDVNFFDYDGTLLHSFAAQDFLSLTELPALPSRDGLICQGWNWSLVDAQEYVQEYSKCDIGATYITDDGKTRLYIKILEGRLSVSLILTITNSVTIDWGDGFVETMEAPGSPSQRTPSHNYDNSGDYCITLSVPEGGSLAFNTSITGASSNTNASRVYQNIFQRVEIGKGVTSIGSKVFQKCFSLSSVTIPQGVTSIGSYAFETCCSLSSITIPQGVTSIGSYAFQNCYSLSSITIPQGVTSIGTYAFQNCYSLSSITIPQGVTIINAQLFADCYSLSSVTIPHGITSIDAYAFSECRSLSSVTIPQGVTSIGSYAFSECRSLSSVTIPQGVTSIGSYAFQNCYSLSSVKILRGTTDIGGHAFMYCYNLKSISLPIELKTIGSEAFYCCKSLSSLELPLQLTSFGARAFSSCHSLVKVTIPKGITEIPVGSFEGNYGAALYDFSSSETVPTLAATGAFSNIASDCKIVVPDLLYDEWIAATNWSTYARYIVKASEYNA